MTMTQVRSRCSAGTRFALFLLLSVLCSVRALSTPAAAAQPAALEPVVSAEGISEYVLDNGLRVVLFPDASKPVTTVNMTYLVGSRHEQYGETGMAHLLEHLLFKGTPTHTDIPGEMKKRGIGFNGTTWLDRTNYYASFSSDPDTLDWVLRLEADRMVNSRVSREDLDSEMTVVRNEMESGENSPVRVLVSRIISTAYLWHNYGNSTIGARADVEHVPIERLQAFYRNYYQPDNAVLVVAGDFDPEATLRRVADYFGAIPRPQRRLQPTYTREPAQDGERSVVVRRVGKTPYLGLGYHVPAGRHDDSGPLAVLANVMGDIPNGRLHKALVATGKATGIGNMHYVLDEPGLLLFLAEAPAGADLDALDADLVGLVEDTAGAPFAEEEVAQARQRLLAGHEISMRDPNAIGVALSEAIAQGDWRLYLLARDDLEKVTAAEVNRVARAYLRRNNRTAGRFIPTESPERVQIPEAPSAAELLKDYTGRAALAAGEAFDPSPANIDARTRSFTLDNGAELAVLSKSTRGGTVKLRIDLRLGDAASLSGRATAAGLVPEMLVRGTLRLDRAAIARRLVELKSSLEVSGDVDSVRVSASSDREHLPALLDLVADVLRDPAFPESEFRQLKAQAVTALRNASTEPQSVASRARSRYYDRWPEGHPYHVDTFEEDLAALEAVTLAQVRDFHRDFYGAASASIALVGDVDADAVHAQLAQRLGDWRAPHPFTRIAVPYQARPATRERHETPDKANAMFLAYLAVPVGQDHADYPALILANSILGGGSLKSRLADRIRQREGLSYGVASGFSASALDENGSFMVYAIAAPQNVARVEAAFHEELERLLRDGVTAAELQEALDGMLKARRTARADDERLADQLASNLYLDRSMAVAAEFEDQLRAQTPESLLAALRRHVKPEAFGVFVAGDFAAAKPEAADE